MRELAVQLGWQEPTSDDGFWFREDRGPVHADDLWPFLRDEIEEFTLVNDPQPLRPRRGEFDYCEPRRQVMLLDGLDCLPGQLDLF